ncbi:MAG: hypothetical protein ABSE84_12310, partial [Isosphaeraceae bacterium]
MPTRDWPRWITSGPTLQALMCSLVSSEDPRAKVFVRLGRDGGQDARSGDGRNVYQAKYHRDGTVGDVIRDANDEAEKIRKYQNADHPRHKQWHGVVEWIQVTNTALTWTEREKWQS